MLAGSIGYAFDNVIVESRSRDGSHVCALPLCDKVKFVEVRRPWLLNDQSLRN